MTRREHIQSFEHTHKLGAAVHTHAWLGANRAAVNAIWECGADPDDEATKALVSKVVLRVLDHVRERTGDIPMDIDTLEHCAPGHNRQDCTCLYCEEIRRKEAANEVE